MALPFIIGAAVRAGLSKAIKAGLKRGTKKVLKKRTKKALKQKGSGGKRTSNIRSKELMSHHRRLKKAAFKRETAGFDKKATRAMGRAADEAKRKAQRLKKKKK